MGKLNNQHAELPNSEWVANGSVKASAGHNGTTRGYSKPGPPTTQAGPPPPPNPPKK